MGTFGAHSDRSNPSGYTYRASWGPDENQVASDLYTMPEDGWINTISVFASPTNGNKTMAGCAWRSDNTLFASTGWVVVGSGAIRWLDFGGLNVWCPAGTQLRIGHWHDTSSVTTRWNLDGPGLGTTWSGGGSGAPGNLAATFSQGNRSGAYISYTPTSAPTTRTDGASGVALNGANVAGACWPQGEPTTIKFRYCTSNSVDGSGQLNGAGVSDTGWQSPGGFGANGSIAGIEFGSWIGGVPNTTYYYQIVAWSSRGWSFGAVQSYTTLGGASNPPTLLGPANGALTKPVNTPFTWTYNPNGGSGQTSYLLQLVAAGVTYYWSGAAFVTVQPIASAWPASGAGSVTIPAASLAPFAGQTVTWTVATQDNFPPGGFASAFTLVVLAVPPAPTLQTPGAITSPTPPTVDLTGSPTFAWQYTGTLSQTAWMLAVQAVGGTWYCWNESTHAWVTTGSTAGATGPTGALTWNTGNQQYVSIPYNTLFPPTAPAGGFKVGTKYVWTVAIQDAGGTSPFPAAAWGVDCELVGYRIDTGATAGDRLSYVNQAMLQLSDGTTVFLDYDPNRPAPHRVALQHMDWSTTTAPVVIGMVSFDSFALGDDQSLALVVDAADNLYVIGRSADNASVIAVQVFARITDPASHHTKTFYQWSAGVVQESPGISVPAGLQKPIASSFVGALAGFAAVWCNTGRFGMLLIICGDNVGNKYAVMVDCTSLRNQTPMVCNTVVNPSFLGGVNAVAIGNLDLSPTSFGATQGVAISPSTGALAQVGVWGVTIGGRLAASGMVDSFTAGLTAATKCRIVRQNPNVWVAIYPSATATRLAVSAYSTGALLGRIDPVPSPTNLTAPWPVAGAALNWDATSTPDVVAEASNYYTALVDEFVWLYSWCNVAGRLADLMRLGIRAGAGRTVSDGAVTGTTLTSVQAGFTAADVGALVKGDPTFIQPYTYIVSVAGNVATLSSNTLTASPLVVTIGDIIVSLTAVVDSPAVGGGSVSAIMSTIRTVRDPVDDTHVGWQANNTAAPGLHGYFSALPEPPAIPFLLNPQSGATPSLAGTALAFLWTFYSDTFADYQSTAYLRLQQQGHGYKWWTGAAWTAEQAAATGGVETAINGAGGFPGQSVSPTGWGPPGTTYSYSVQVVGRSMQAGGVGLKSGYSDAATFTIGNTPPPAPTLTALPATTNVFQRMTSDQQIQQAIQLGMTLFWIDPAGAPNSYLPVAPSNVYPGSPFIPLYVQRQVNVTRLTLTLNPTDGGVGVGASTQASFEYSDDGQQTWTFLRNGQSVVLPDKAPPAPTTYTVDDQELTPVYTRWYRAQTWTDFWPVGYSAYAMVSVHPVGLARSWLTDPADGLTLGLDIKPGSFTMTQLEDMTIHYPLGRRLPLVVFSDVHGQDGSVTLITQNFVDEAVFQTLMQRQTVLLLRTPEPAHWYIRRTGPVSTDRPLPMMTGYREHHFTYVEVARPSGV